MSSYLFDPFNPSEIERLKKELETDLDDKVLKYIIFLYDINSEYRRLYPEYVVRKKETAIKAGFKLNKKSEFDADDEAVILGENADVNLLIMKFLKLFNNPDYILYVSFWELLGGEIVNSIKETDPKIKKVIGDNIGKFGSAISRLEENIFGGKEILSMRNALYATLINERLLRPEEIARQTAEKTLNLKVDPFYG